MAKTYERTEAICPIDRQSIYEHEYHGETTIYAECPTCDCTYGEVEDHRFREQLRETLRDKERLTRVARDYAKSIPPELERERELLTKTPIGSYKRWLQRHISALEAALKNAEQRGLVNKV